MTFKESDFPAVLDQIETICASEKDPAATVEIIRQVIKVYKQIPLYPGLVELVSNAIEEEVERDELSEGDFISLKDGNEFYLGTIKRIKPHKIQLENVIHTNSSEEKEIELNQFADYFRINEDALQQEWPELYYEDDE